MRSATVREWLAAAGLSLYADLFESNRIGLDVLPHLTEEDLKDLGIPLGDRKRLALAIQAERAPQPSRAEAPEASPQAERRQLTVLFCDLVGSTELATTLDPEELRALMGAYRNAASAAVQRYGGHVAQQLGDGLMAYFGWPRAEEDAAARAVSAALDCTEAVKGVAGPGPLRVRIGIATGAVVVGDADSQAGEAARLAVGETPNVAARLQAIAGPDQVVVAESTRRLAAGMFDYTDLGSQALKGIREPLRCWRVERRAQARSRFEALHGASLTPLVGRELEVGLLLERWQQAAEGDGQVVLLSGEAGIGKSRIVHALREHIGAAPHQVLLTQCSPLHSNTAFHPLVENLSAWAGIASEVSAAQKLDQLDAFIARMQMSVPEVGPLFAAVLSIQADGRYPASSLTPQRQRERTIEAIAQRVIAFTRRDPLLFIVEDAHWADPSTLDCLALIIQRARGVGALVIVTHRPEFEPPWHDQPQVMALTLSRLGRRQAADLVSKVAGGMALPDEILDQVVAKTDGVPLFVEELTKTVLEAGALRERGGRLVLDGPLPALTVPSTLRDSLMARLDRLVPVKEVAQIGACIGREFPDRLLAAVAGLAVEKVDSALEQLVASGLIWRSGVEGTYAFKHALVQEAAYGSLLNARRQQLHARIAAELETGWPDVVRTQPELVAHHHASAGQAEHAIDYLAAAGQSAIQRSANVEAVRVLERAIGLLAALPETAARLERELELQTALATPLMAVRTYSAPEVGRLYERSYELSRRLGKPALMYPALAGIASFHVTRSELDRSLELSGEMLRSAEADGDQAAMMEAHRLLGMTRQWMGDLTGARLDFARVLALYDPARHPALASVYGQDHRMSALCWEAWSLLYLGYPDQAVTTRRAALDAAAATPHVFSRLYAPAVTMNVLQFTGDAAGMVASGDDLVRVSEEQGIAAWRAWGYTGGGWAQARLGDGAAGLRQIELGLAMFRVAEVGVLLPFHLGMAAEVCMLLRRLDEAAGYLAEAVDYVERGGQRWFAAEAYRLMAELALLQGELADAEGHFGRAAAVARSQMAKGWELRAALGHARLMRQQGRQGQALRLLQPLYQWFTEGFETQDLREARLLLDELKA